MKQFDGNQLLALVHNSVVLSISGSTALKDRQLGDEAKFSAETVDGLLRDVSQMRDSCIELGLSVARQKVESIASSLESARHDAGKITDAFGELERIVKYELASHVFLYIEPTQAHLYTDADLFGSDVASNFPSTAYDVEEAGKCLALNRATACVFHLMRVLEAGLYALATDLPIPSIQENWQNAIEQIEKAVRGLPPGDGRIQPYSEAAAYLMHVKEAWRNRTAHIGRVYTEEKAQQIFDNVRAFMQLLATRLAEKEQS